nr:hypothetical protein [Micromonospora sp. DSM 115978]
MPDPCRIDGRDPCPPGPCPCRMPTLPPPLICQGRPVFGDGLTVGEQCGRQYRCPDYVNDGTGRPRLATVADQDQHARAAGWSVAGPPMCPACRRPDPAITRDLTQPAPADRDHEEGDTVP